MTPLEYAEFVFNTYGGKTAKAFFDNLVSTGLDLESDFWWEVADELWVITFEADPLAYVATRKWVEWDGGVE